MKTTLVIAAGLVSLLSTGCATKKYVRNTVSPVEQRVGVTETKNSEQDKVIGTHGQDIEGIGGELSKTKEKLADTDVKATRAGEVAAQAGDAAKAADQKAGTAQQAANSATQAAEGARTFAEQGLTRLDQSMQAMNKFAMSKEQAVLFGFDSDVLTKEAKAQLDELGNSAKGLGRYVIEVEGFTDQSGDARYNDALSQRRAQVVARYLANQHQIPVRNISMLGVGQLRPASEEKSANGRKMNRRVEVRLWVPETESTKVAVASGSNQ